MGKLTYLIIHCTATPEGRAVSSKEIRDWHINKRGWHQVGYSDMVHLDGTLESLVSYDKNQMVDQWEITNGVKGMNSVSRHIVYVGGLAKDKRTPRDTRTDKQKYTLMLYILKTLRDHPEIKIAGHYHFAAKACPSFDVEKWLESINIPEKNIYRKPTVSRPSN